MTTSFIISNNGSRYFNSDSYISDICDLERIICDRDVFTKVCYKFNYIEPSLDDFIAMIKFFVEKFNLEDNLDIQFCDTSIYKNNGRTHKIKDLKNIDVRKKVYEHIKNKADNESINIDINDFTNGIKELFSAICKFNDILKVTYDRKYFEPDEYEIIEQKQMLFELIEKYNEVYRRVFKEKNRNMINIVRGKEIITKVEANKLARKLNDILIKKDVN